MRSKDRPNETKPAYVFWIQCSPLVRSKPAMRLPFWNQGRRRTRLKQAEAWLQHMELVFLAASCSTSPDDHHTACLITRKTNILGK